MFHHLKRDLSVFNRRYFESLYFLTKTAIMRQYRESFLGMFWSVIQPGIQVVVLSLVFTLIVRFDTENYTLLLMSGFLPWTFMHNSFSLGSNSLILKSILIKNGCILPKTMFIISDTFVGIYVMLVSFVAMYLVVGTFFTGLSFYFFLLPVVLLPVIIFTICVCVILAYVAPYMKDISHLIGIVMGSLFWSVPIVYPASVIPDKYLIFFEINPFYILIKPIQELVHGSTFPSIDHLVYAFGVAFISFILSWIVQKKLRRNVVYYL